jgi:release factor glutamine methyltransferase
MTVERGDTVKETLERGWVRFMGLELHAAPGALVPRAETELLGETAARIISERQASAGPQHVIDMCCGAGNLACAIASRIEHARVFAADLTEGCVSVAKKNVEKHGLGHRVSVHQGDLFDAFTEVPEKGAIDVVVCNPPYISTSKLTTERQHLTELEPREAFDGGPYGITIHQRVTREALTWLKPDGVLLFEVGVGQDRQVKILFQRARGFTEVTTVVNETGEVRVLFAKKAIIP